LGDFFTNSSGQPAALHRKSTQFQYLGRWYEYSNYFAFFQLFGKCVTAEYSLLPRHARNLIANSLFFWLSTTKFLFSIKSLFANLLAVSKSYKFGLRTRRAYIFKIQM
jgi:hypothetical protein